MCEEVGLEVGPLVEAPLTDGAAVRRLLVVEDLVHGQGAVLAETFTTIIALERLLFGVDVAMVPAIVQMNGKPGLKVTSIEKLSGRAYLLDVSLFMCNTI